MFHDFQYSPLLIRKLVFINKVLFHTYQSNPKEENTEFDTSSKGMATLDGISAIKYDNLVPFFRSRALEISNFPGRGEPDTASAASVITFPKASVIISGNDKKFDSTVAHRKARRAKKQRIDVLPFNPSVHGRRVG